MPHARCDQRSKPGNTEKNETPRSIPTSPDLIPFFRKNTRHARTGYGAWLRGSRVARGGGGASLPRWPPSDADGPRRLLALYPRPTRISVSLSPDASRPGAWGARWARASWVPCAKCWLDWAMEEQLPASERHSCRAARRGREWSAMRRKRRSLMRICHKFLIFGTCCGSWTRSVARAATIPPEFYLFGEVV